jgi:hypothetical protein
MTALVRPPACMVASWIADVIKKVRLAGKAPRTVRNIYSVISAMFRDARIADLVEQTPAVLNKYIPDSHSRHP